ncbi:hypothetical protein JL11_07845 [Brevundimonas sp. DS20]|nr:hypothetical protein JL11_07845 [Brevundimonas sp. DS20]
MLNGPDLKLNQGSQDFAGEGVFLGFIGRGPAFAMVADGFDSRVNGGQGRAFLQGVDGFGAGQNPA